MNGTVTALCVDNSYLLAVWRRGLRSGWRGGRNGVNVRLMGGNGNLDMGKRR
jgi:hypothetical protein